MNKSLALIAQIAICAVVVHAEDARHRFTIITKGTPGFSDGSSTYLIGMNYKDFLGKFRQPSRTKGGGRILVYDNEGIVAIVTGDNVAGFMFLFKRGAVTTAADAGTDSGVDRRFGFRQTTQVLGKPDAEGTSADGKVRGASYNVRDNKNRYAVDFSFSTEPDSLISITVMRLREPDAAK